jgi:hypothetical protein
MPVTPLQRRLILLSPLFAAVLGSEADASPINPAQTFVEQANQIAFKPWAGLPAGSGEMAPLYGDIDRPGPYLVLMRWNPGWFSAPHDYATDRIQMVLSGTWWVNSGPDFAPGQAVQVHAGGFVRRTARTWHYDGVPGYGKEPVTVAVFGTGPVDMRLADPRKLSWRRA